MKETEDRCLNCRDCDYPEHVESRGCQADVSGLFGSRNIPEAFWEISERPAPPDAGQGGR